MSALPEPEPAAGGEVEGRVELVHDGIVEGWAWRPSAPEQRLTVRVELDGEEVATTVAELERPSLAAAGIGDGGHAYRLALPVAVDLRSARLLRVEAGDGTDASALAPAGGFEVTYADPSGPWWAVRFQIDHPESTGLAPPVDGRVEQVTDGAVDGWAWLPAAPDERIAVRVLLDGEEVGTAAADLPRESLAAAGIGDGGHAFHVALPERLAYPGLRTVRVEAAGDALPPAAGFRVADVLRSDDPWYGARFTVDVLAPAEVSPPGAVAPPPAAAPAPPGRQAVSVLGRDGWLFDAGIIAPGGGAQRRASGEDRVAAMLDRLDTLDARLAAIEVKLLPILLPLKEYVYRGRLPPGAEDVLPARPGELVAVGLLDHPTLEPLDLLLPLVAGAELWPTFSPVARTLSEWGQYCAYRAMIKRIAAMLAGVPPPVELGEAGVVPAPSRPPAEPVGILHGDRLILCRPEEVPPAPGDPVVVAPRGQAQATQPEHLARLGEALAIGWEQPDQPDLARAMFVGEERHAALAHWAGRHFRYTVMIAPDAPAVDLASLERPDVLAYIVDERMLLDLSEP